MPLAPRRPLASSATRKLKVARRGVSIVSRSATKTASPSAVPTLRLFQAEDVAFIKAHDYRVLVANAPGTGKTCTSLVCVAGDREKLTPTIVVCPASVVTNWCREAKKWVPGAVIHAITDLTSKMPTRKVEVFVISWALLSERYLDLVAIKPQFIIADEAHYAKGGEDTLRGQALAILARRTPHMILLSGTPLVNRPAELETIKGLFGTQEVPMIRRHLEDVLPEIPPKSRSVLRVRMRPKDEADYRKAQKEFAEWLEVELSRRLSAGEARAAAERTLAAEALTKTGYLRRLVGLAKVPAAIDWISKAVRVGEPVVVFCEHQEVVSRLQRFLTKQRIRHVTIDGGTARKQRQAAIDAFQNGLCPVFIGTKAAKEGITLTRGRNLLFVERYFTSADEEQAEDRIRRFGQAHPTTVWFLHANDTLDDRLQEIIETKRKIVAEHLGSVHIEETEEGAVLELISAWHENAAKLHQPDAEATDLGLGKPLPPLPSTSEVLRLSFRPGRWVEGTARAWATMHGYKAASVVTKEGIVRINVVPLDRFVSGAFRTVQVSADISAVVGERKPLPRKKGPTKTVSKGSKGAKPPTAPVRSTQRDFRRSPLLRRRG
jgi:superfamily II DNA or RNA helicase